MSLSRRHFGRAVLGSAALAGAVTLAPSGQSKAVAQGAATFKRRLTGADMYPAHNWRVGGTDLGIPYVLENGSIGYLMGDTFAGPWPESGGDHRSPVMLRSAADPASPDGIIFDSAAKVAGNGRAPELMYNAHGGWVGGRRELTGRTWSKEELLAVAGLCLKYKIRIIADEIHSDIILKEGRNIPTASLSEEIAAITTTCLSPTKTFNLAGLQTSIIHFSSVEDKALYDAITAKTHVGNSNSFAVCATETAFAEGEEWLEQMKDYVYENILFVHNFIRENLPQIKSYIPQGTYLMWLDMRALGMEPKELMKFMLRKARLALNGGDAFGTNGEGFMRLNCATRRAVLEQAMKQLKQAVSADSAR